MGQAALDAIVEFDLKGEEEAPNAVWKNSGEPTGDWEKFKHMFKWVFWYKSKNYWWILYPKQYMKK